MGFFSNKVKRHKLKPGDHIYTYRTGYIYAHHGIFVGDNTVIHFTSRFSPSSSSFFSSSSSSGPGSKCTFIPKSECGYMDPHKTSAVISSCLDCFLKKGSIYRFEYGVRKTVARTRIRGGTCSRKHADPPEDTIRRANYLLRTGFGDYYLTVLNCENFASYCKTSFVHKKKGRIGICGQFHSGLYGIPKNIAKGWDALWDSIKGNVKSHDKNRETKMEVEELDSFIRHRNEGSKKVKVEVEELASFLQKQWDSDDENES